MEAMINSGKVERTKTPLLAAVFGARRSVWGITQHSQKISRREFSNCFSTPPANA